MLEAHGLLQLTVRSETYRSEAQLLHRTTNRTPKNSAVSATASQSGSQAHSGSLTGKSAVTVPKGAIDGPMHDFWQQAADKAAQRAPSADTLKKLQDASKSDNQDIAAQKMQEAKAKLQSLRLQAQLAAASGDKQQLRRLAQEVAAAAHEVAAAAHDLSEGVVASATDTGSTSVSELASGADDQTASDGNSDANGNTMAATPARDAAQNTAPTAFNAATGAQPAAAALSPGPAQGTDIAGSSATKTDNGTDTDKADANKPLYAQAAPQDGDILAWGQKALNSLATDANNAIAQARGLLAFIASAARNKRKASEAADDDRFFTDLQREIDGAQSQVNSDIANAHQALLSAQDGGDAGNLNTGNLGTDGVDTGDVDTGGPDTGGSDAGSSLFGLASVTVTQVTTTAVFLNITA